MKESQINQLIKTYIKGRNPYVKFDRCWLSLDDESKFYKVSYENKKTGEIHFSFLPRSERNDAIQMMINEVKSITA